MSLGDKPHHLEFYYIQHILAYHHTSISKKFSIKENFFVVVEPFPQIYLISDQQLFFHTISTNTFRSGILWYTFGKKTFP